MKKRNQSQYGNKESFVREEYDSLKGRGGFQVQQDYGEFDRDRGGALFESRREDRRGHFNKNLRSERPYGGSFGRDEQRPERIYDASGEADGLFAGRGPKGYRRSDERIKEEVCESLMEDPFIDASEIDVEVESGIVTLKGTVEDRRMKRLAEDCVETVRGVSDVLNELRLHAESQISSPESQPWRRGESDSISSRHIQSRKTSAEASKTH